MPFAANDSPMTLFDIERADLLTSRLEALDAGGV
jgi:hypothetical protein